MEGIYAEFKPTVKSNKPVNSQIKLIVIRAKSISPKKPVSRSIVSLYENHKNI